MATNNNGAQRTALNRARPKNILRDSGDEYSVCNITEGLLETALTILQAKINHRITIKKDYHYDESIGLPNKVKNKSGTSIFWIMLCTQWSCVDTSISKPKR
ncbi:MAG: hypothetical protein IPN87_19820 [Saprospiraceae bacterium]|nr:hypothetical protein [Candidatus Brachybacter algidus]